MTTNPHGSAPVFTIADRLRKARETAKLGQRELAELIGISRGTIANYEAGTYPPKRPVLLSWSIATGVTLEWLQTGRLPGGDGSAVVPPSGTQLPYPDASDLRAA